MTDLDRALADIAAIKSQMARSVIFRGYGPEALAATGVLAAVAAGAQAYLVADSVASPTGFLGVWAATAVLAALIIVFEAVRRARQAHGRMADEMLLSAVEQFLPAGAAGILLTLVLQRSAPETLWMLPGLWQIILSLGIFAASASLPRTMLLVAVWYLATGLACLVFASGTAQFAPIAMGLPFCVGQLLAAAVLHFAYRDCHVEIR